LGPIAFFFCRAPARKKSYVPSNNQYDAENQTCGEPFKLLAFHLQRFSFVVSCAVFPAALALKYL
jgi:hypothetical protein